MNHFPNEAPSNDNELLGLFVVNDDQKAFEQIVARHAPMVMHICRTFLWNSADCEDAVQAVFLLLAKKSRSLMRHNCIGGWLHNVAVKTSLNRRRSIQRRREVEMEFDTAIQNEEPWESIANSQLFETLHLEISRLPKRYRDVLVLCYLNGMNRSAAAENLDTTTSSVKASLARAKKLLRNRLVRRGVGMSVAIGTAFSSIKHAGAAEQMGGLLSSLQSANVSSGAGIATANNLNFAQLLSTKGLSAMPLGIVHMSLAAALGLISIGTIGLGVTAANSNFSAPIETTVVVSQEESALQSDATEIEIQPVPEPPETEVASENINTKILQAEILHQQALSQFGASHPNVSQLAAKVALLKDMAAKFAATELQLDKENETLVAMLVSQRKEVQNAIQHFGSNHPLVEAAKAKLATLEQFQQALQEGTKTSATQQSDVSLSTDSTPKAASKNLSDLLLQLKVVSQEQRQKYGNGHPMVQSLEQQIQMTEKALNEQKASEPETVTDETLKKLFAIQPRHKGAEFTRPATFAGISVAKSSTEYEAKDLEGNTLRRFVDQNGDRKIDCWIYFNLGRETYRDIDRDLDGKVDEAHFIVGDKIRIGTDKDQDGTIDVWNERRLSDLGR